MSVGGIDVGLVEWIVALVRIYGWIGVAAAAAFLVLGIDRMDPGARGAYAFRPLIAPGVIVLWPLVLWRWAAFEFKRS